MMQFLKYVSSKSFGLISTNPGSAAALFIFGLGFMLVTGNALFSQKGMHPDPLWATASDEENLTQSFEPEIVKASKSKSITRSVLTQRISLKNIPVPTVNPARVPTISSQSSLVRDVQSVLADIGFYEGKVDGIYGSATREAIIKFQERGGILSNGEASYDLLNNLRSVQAVAVAQQTQVKDTKVETTPVQPQLIVFDTETITRIQSGLKEKFGDEDISIDGLMGNQTRNAISRFQKRFKLEANGELDDLTIQKLLSVGILNSI